MSLSGDECSTKGGRRRRYWSDEEKRQIVAESLAEGASIAEVARRYELNANLLFTWRRQLGAETAGVQEMPAILPVTIAPETVAEHSSSGTAGQMEIILAEGERIIVWADVEPTALTRVLKALSRR
jgi:transposase